MISETSIGNSLSFYGIAYMASALKPPLVDST